MELEEAGKRRSILLVEDNRADARLITEALLETGSRVALNVVEDGNTAMAYLRREPPHTASPRPDLIVLDLNLPGKDGREVLAEILADEHLRRIPVLVLTSSRNWQDVQKSYDLGANCYITKPVSLDRFISIVQAIEDFWLDIVTLPEE